MMPEGAPSRLPQPHSLHVLRFTNAALLIVLPVEETQDMVTEQKAFSVVAPSLWNSLPQDTHHALT